MYKQLLLVSTLSFGLAVAPSAMAKSKDEGHRDAGRDRGHVVEHRDTRGNDRNNDRRNDRDARQGGDHRDTRHDARKDSQRDSWSDAHEHRRHADAHERQWQQARYRVAPYRAPHGYSHHSWRRGERLPSGYRVSRYVVHDYRNYHLHSPPRGHQWVRVDRDVVLTAVGTGIVAAVIYNIFA